jgi:hypothetical protein
MITQQEVKDLFDYDPDTGVCTWKVLRYKAGPGEPIDERYRQKSGYIVIGIKGSAYNLHRLIWLWVKGEMPKNEIDHINGNIVDNRWLNLREVTRQENAFNRKTRSDKKCSSFIGVMSRGKKWMAIIRVDGKRMSFGTYPTEEEAHQAYLHAKRLFHGHTRYDLD